MDLQAINKQYDFAVGLGCTCMVAHQLKRLGLRKFASPVDTILVNDINQLNKAIECSFKNFMRLRNLKISKEMPKADPYHYVVLDTLYDCYSLHDFPTRFTKYLWFTAYPSFIKKISRRAENFLKNISEADSVLFVRTSEEFEYEGAKRLKELLTQKTRGSFNILAVKYGEKFEEIDCDEDNICFVEIPHDTQKDNWKGIDAVWDLMLGGARVRDTFDKVCYPE